MILKNLFLYRIAILVSILFIGNSPSWSASDDVNPSAPRSIVKKKSNSVTVKESILDIQGKTFRKIEYQNEAYFLELTESPTQVAGGDLRLLCQKHIAPNEISGSLIKVGAQITSRAHIFVDALRQNCKEALDSGSRRVIQVDPRLQVGFEYDFKNQDLSKNKVQKNNEIFKNIKLVLTPIDGVSFKADW